MPYISYGQQSAQGEYADYGEYLNSQYEQYARESDAVTHGHREDREVYRQQMPFREPSRERRTQPAQEDYRTYAQRAPYRAHGGDSSRTGTDELKFHSNVSEAPRQSNPQDSQTHTRTRSRIPSRSRPPTTPIYDRFDDNDIESLRSTSRDRTPASWQHGHRREPIFDPSARIRRGTSQYHGVLIHHRREMRHDEGWHRAVPDMDFGGPRRSASGRRLGQDEPSDEENQTNPVYYRYNYG